MRTRTRSAVAALAVTAALALTGCAKCDGPNRVYVVYHGDSKYGALAVLPNDPRCR